MSTVAPELSPITKAMKKNITGKNTETAREHIDPDHLAEVNVVNGAEQ